MPPAVVIFLPVKELLPTKSMITADIAKTVIGNSGNRKKCTINKKKISILI